MQSLWKIWMHGSEIIISFLAKFSIQITHLFLLSSKPSISFNLVTGNFSISELLFKEGFDREIDLNHALENSKMLSSDVSAAYDPLYGYAYDKDNVCFFGRGIVFNKYTGSRGKGGCNDANPEFIAWLRNALDEENIYFQTSELGKVDQGGGGTIAYILGNMNMDVIDAGIPLLNMHSTMEIVSKADLFEAYEAYKVFLLAK
mgnify:CR=1 FL=1